MPESTSAWTQPTQCSACPIRHPPSVILTCTRYTAAQLERYTIEMDEKMAVAASERTVALEKTTGEKEVAVTEAKGEIEVAVYTGRMNKNELVTSTGIEEDRRVREAVQQAEAKVIDSRSSATASR